MVFAVVGVHILDGWDWRGKSLLFWYWKPVLLILRHKTNTATTIQLHGMALDAGLLGITLEVLQELGHLVTQRKGVAKALVTQL